MDSEPDKDSSADSYITSDASTEVEEDETGDLITPQLDAQILKTIAMIRRKDPELYNREMTRQFFDEGTLNNLDAGKKYKGKMAPVTLKDYHARLLLEGDQPEVLPHAQEETLLKDEMKAAFDIDEDSSDDLLVPTAKGQADKQGEEASYRRFLEETVGATDLQTALRLGAQGGLDKDDEDFLSNYILKRGWVDRDIKEADLSESDDFEEKADRFESAYNFRFEMPGGSELISHSRELEDSVRRKPEARKRQREAAAERKAAEKLARAEDTKRSKRARRQETAKRLDMIREVLQRKGADEENLGLTKKDLEDDFDPENHDKRMDVLFDEAWYADGTDDIDKPEFHDDEFESVSDTNHEKKLDKITNGPDADLTNLEILPTAKIKEFAQYEEERLRQDEDQLDYEDTIGDLKTRFRYTKVPQETYGLSAVDILLADDTDLNQHVGLRRIAPYREQSSAQREAKVLSKKARLREFKRSLQDKGVSWDNPNADADGSRMKRPNKESGGFDATGSNQVPLPRREKKRKGKRERLRAQAQAEAETKNDVQ